MQVDWGSKGSTEAGNKLAKAKVIEFSQFFFGFSLFHSIQFFQNPFVVVFSRSIMLYRCFVSFLAFIIPSLLKREPKKYRLMTKKMELSLVLVQEKAKDPDVLPLLR